MIKSTKRFVGDKNSWKIFVSSDYNYIGVRCREDGLLFKAFKEPVGDWLCRPVDSSSRILIPRIAVKNYDLNGYVDAIVDTDESTVLIQREGKPFVITDYTKVSTPSVAIDEMKNVSVGAALKAVSSFKRVTLGKTFKIGYCNTKDRIFMKIERIDKSETEGLPTYASLTEYYGNSLVYFTGYVEFASSEFLKLFIKKDTKNVAMSVTDDCIIISPEMTQCDFNEEHIIMPAKQKAKKKVLCSDCAKAEEEISDGVTEIERLLEQADRLVRMVDALKRENGILREQISILNGVE